MLTIALSLKRVFGGTWGLVKAAFSEWGDDRCPRLGAALSFYTIFSMAPLIMITIGLASLIFGQEAARGQIYEQINGLVGEKGAAAIEDMIASSRQTTTGIMATVFGLLTLIFGASGVFVGLQDSLNTVWEVQLKPGRSLWNMIHTRLLSFAAVLGIGFLLLVSLILSAALAAMGKWLANWIPAQYYLLQIANFVLSF